jgi:hypothetical protein
MLRVKAESAALREALEKTMQRQRYSHGTIRSYGWQFRAFSEFAQRVPRKLNTSEVTDYFKELWAQKRSRSVFLQASGMLGILYRDVAPDARIEALLSNLQDRYMPQRKSG